VAGKAAMGRFLAKAEKARGQVYYVRRRLASRPSR
jgi:hypothetical protein